MSFADPTQGDKLAVKNWWLWVCHVLIQGRGRSEFLSEGDEMKHLEMAWAHGESDDKDREECDRLCGFKRISSCKMGDGERERERKRVM